MPINFFGAVHVVAALAALAGGRCGDRRCVAASIDCGDDWRRTPLFWGPVHSGWHLPVARARGAERSCTRLVRSVCALKAGSSAIEVSALPRSGLRQSTAPSEPAVSVARSAPPRSGWLLVCIMGTFLLETGSACGAPGARLLSDRVVRIAHV